MKTAAVGVFSPYEYQTTRWAYINSQSWNQNDGRSILFQSVFNKLFGFFENLLL